MKCSLASTGAVNVGDAECALVEIVYHTLQLQVAGQESGPRDGKLGAPGVPNHAMPIRPSSPAAIHGMTLVCNVPAGDAEVSMVIGVAQVFPWSVE